MGMITIISINKNLETISNVISKLSHLYIYNKYYGYYNNDFTYKNNLEKLQSYLDIYKSLKLQYKFNTNYCLTDKEYSKLQEKVNSICLNQCSDLKGLTKVDTSREEFWVFKNPFCRSYESWEKWSKFYCGKLKLEINIEKIDIPNLIMEISRNIITPNILLSITAYKQVKNLNLELSRTKKENKLDFKLLKEKVTDLELTPYEYSDLTNNFNLSFDIIKEVYKEGLSLENIDGNIYLVTKTSKYNLDDLSETVDMSYLKSQGLELTTTLEKLLQDYKK